MIGKDGDRATVCAKYKVFLKKQIGLGLIRPADLTKLHGKDLVCYCAPAECHGHSLEKAALWAFEYLHRLSSSKATTPSESC